jgi:DNA-binding MarR family transcriptional regulator
MPKNRRLIYQLNQARHSLMKHMDSVCRKELEVPVVQVTALMAIAELENCQMKDLAKTLMLDKSAVTGLAQRLLKNDLISKRPSQTDSRASLLTLTTKGQKTLSEGLKLLKSGNQTLMNGFSDKELDTVSRFLTHITHTFSQGVKK